MQQYGAQTLSEGELLSLVLCTSAARETLFSRIEALLKAYGGLSWLMRTDFAALSSEYGLGEVKAAQLQAVLELARRLTLPPQEKPYEIRSAADAARLVMADMAFLDHEQLRVLVLDTKNGVIANVPLYKGTLNSSVVLSPEVFRLAIIRNGAGVMVIHNHPSGNCTPSPEDEQITEQLRLAEALLDIELVDHIIIGNQTYVSMRERIRW